MKEVYCHGNWDCCSKKPNHRQADIKSNKTGFHKNKLLSQTGSPSGIKILRQVQIIKYFLSKQVTSQNLITVDSYSFYSTFRNLNVQLLRLYTMCLNNYFKINKVHLRKAGGYSGRNFMWQLTTISMRTRVRKITHKIIISSLSFTVNNFLWISFQISVIFNDIVFRVYKS